MRWEQAEQRGSPTEVTFDVRNNGKQSHEPIVIKTDADRGALPLQGAPGDEEKEGLRPGRSRTSYPARGRAAVPARSGQLRRHLQRTYQQGIRTGLGVQ
jgi:hypothetical protein